MSDLTTLSTYSLLLAVRIVSCIKGIENADGEDDATIQQSMALSFAIELEKKIAELDERLMRQGTELKEVNKNTTDVDCMLDQAKEVLSCILGDTTDAHSAGLVGSVITVVNAAQEKLNS